jgi:hypothetical protein
LIGKQTPETVAQELDLTVEQVRYRYFRMKRKLEVGLALFTGQPIGAVQSSGR